MKKTILLAGISIVVLAFYFYSSQAPEVVEISQEVVRITSTVESEVEVEEIDEEVEDAEPEVEPVEEEGTATIKIKSKSRIAAPFIVQAPFADWSERYQETCEEAAMLIVYNFYKGVESLTEEEMKEQIDELTDWSDQFYNGRLDTTIEESSEFLVRKFGFDKKRIQLIDNPSIEDLKAILDKGYPIVVPAAGRELGNKYYTPPGPLYHMLVLVGYDNDEFITNDPGTKRGEGYRYKYDVLYNAIHDWTGNYDTILQGKKRVLVVTPE